MEMNDADRIKELEVQLFEVEEELGESREQYNDVFAKWRKEFWRAERAEKNLEMLIGSINGAVNRASHCQHEMVYVKDDGTGDTYCANPACDVLVNTEMGS